MSFIIIIYLQLDHWSLLCTWLTRTSSFLTCSLPRSYVFPVMDCFLNNSCEGCTFHVECKFHDPHIPRVSLHFANLLRLDCPKFHSSRSLRSTTFELLLRTISTWCQPNRHIKCTSLVPVKSRTSEFLRNFRPDLFWVGHLVWTSRECHYIHSSWESYPFFFSSSTHIGSSNPE
jgi:hypothetical protein